MKYTYGFFLNSSEFLDDNEKVTMVWPMNVEFKFWSDFTSFCTQPQSNEIECITKYKSPDTNITTTYFEHYQFCDWGYAASYVFPEENLTTQETLIRLEGEDVTPYKIANQTMLV
jgi:hypothetical protein